MEFKVFALIVNCINVILCIILILQYPPALKQTCRPNPSLAHTIKVLIRQAARWAIAARQDTDIMIAVLHANYGAAYLWAARDIATDHEIAAATGINPVQFRDEIITIQDEVTRRLARTCPKFAPSHPEIPRVAQMAISY